jgi:hypothetical protein
MQVNGKADAFEIDQRAKTFSFRLPESVSINDMIFFTRDNGILVKKVEITREILNSARYTFDAGMLPPGNYIITVAGGSKIKYSFKYTNKPSIKTVTIKDSKLMTTSFTGSKALKFNSVSREFAVASDIKFTEGTKIEVFDDKDSLVATSDVTKEMIAAKEYFIKVPQIKNGRYAVSVDGVKFGTVAFAE